MRDVLTPERIGAAFGVVTALIVYGLGYSLSHSLALLSAATLIGGGMFGLGHYVGERGLLRRLSHQTLAGLTQVIDAHSADAFDVDVDDEGEEARPCFPDPNGLDRRGGGRC